MYQRYYLYKWLAWLKRLRKEQEIKAESRFFKLSIASLRDYLYKIISKMELCVLSHTSIPKSVDMTTSGNKKIDDF